MDEQQPATNNGGGGFNIPKLNLGFKKNPQGFSVNDASQKDMVNRTGADTDTALPASAMKRKLNESDIMPGNTVGPTDPNFVWEYPPLSLLSDNPGGEANRGDVKSNAEIIERTLGSFGIKAKVVEVNYGPAVTQYALEIALGTKVSKITDLATDLALALAAPTGQIRIEAPIAGRALVGVEVPNHSAQFVQRRTMLAPEKLTLNPSKLA